MGVVLGEQEQSPSPQVLDDLRVRLVHVLPLEESLGDLLRKEASVVAYGVERTDAVARPDVVVVGSVPRCRMDEPRSGLERHVLAEKQQRLPPPARGDVGRAGPDLLAAAAPLDDLEPVEKCEDLGVLPAELGPHRPEKPARDEEDLPAAFDRGVVVAGMKGDRAVRRQGPWGRGPDDGRHRPVREQGREGGASFQGELHEDGAIRPIPVLHLGLGEGRAAREAPVDRQLAVVDPPLGEEPAEDADDLRLVRPVDRPVDGLAVRLRFGLLPPVRAEVPEHPEPPELLPLDLDESLGVLPAEAAFLQGRQREPRLAEVLVDAVLDGESVAVPARDVWGVEAHHRAGLHDEVLQDLVQGLAEVDAGVRVGGPVVKDVEGAPPAGFADQPVQLDLIPPIQPRRLAAGQLRFHRKIGPGKVDRLLEFDRIAHRAALGEMLEKRR